MELGWDLGRTWVALWWHLGGAWGSINATVFNYVTNAFSIMQLENIRKSKHLEKKYKENEGRRPVFYYGAQVILKNASLKLP